MGFKHLILALTSLLAIVSCQKEIAGQPDMQDGDPSLNPEAVLFYSNLSCIIKATINSPLASAGNYPLMEKLADMEIELEDGSTTGFFDLPKEQQIVFCDKYTQYLAGLLSEKIAQVPLLEQYIAAQNKIVSDIIATLGTKSGEPVIDDPGAFFTDLGGKMDELASGFTYETSQTRNQHEWDEVDYDRLLNLLAGQAKRGNIIVALPLHGQAWCLLNLGRDAGQWGHAEIFTKDITSTTTDTEYVSIGARLGEGVAFQTLPSWRRKSYLLEVCRFHILWKWDGWNSGFRVIQTPVPTPSLLASWAESYEGKDYSYWYETLAPKWFAPSRFTCTTLIWWCARKAYDIRISPWFSTLVSPSDVLCDYNTRLKETIE